MSFNRRPNRIAGPGFNINVRYDDQHMYKARSSANGADTAVNSANSVENFDVKEAELLVAKNEGTMYHDGMTHCFSSANGFPKGTSGLSVERDILSQVRFIGVALTEYQPSKAYSEQGFVAQVGGVVTLINEGTDIIKPGDKVELGLNLSKRRKQTREKGIPRSKIRFCIQKATSTDEKIKNAIVAHNLASTASTDPSTATETQAATNAVQAAEAAVQAQEAKVAAAELVVSNAATPTAAQKKKVKDEKKALVPLEKALRKAEAELAKCTDCKFETTDLREFLKIYEKSQSHVIGKAYSYARPGDRLEVGLQPRHPY
jgi:hypothetical protein